MKQLAPGWPPPIGAKLREDYGHDDGFMKKLWHVRAHVDDAIVVRVWTKKWGGSWHYEVKFLGWWYVMMNSKAKPLTVELPVNVEPPTPARSTE